MAHHAANTHHAEHYATSSYDRTHPHLDYLLKRKLKAERKHEEYHTDVSPRMYARHIAHTGRIGHVRSCQEACHNVAQHEGLLQAFEQ